MENITGKGLLNLLANKLKRKKTVGAFGKRKPFTSFDEKETNNERHRRLRNNKTN